MCAPHEFGRGVHSFVHTPSPRSVRPSLKHKQVKPRDAGHLQFQDCCNRTELFLLHVQMYVEGKHRWQSTFAMRNSFAQIQGVSNAPLAPMKSVVWRGGEGHSKPVSLVSLLVCLRTSLGANQTRKSCLMPFAEGFDWLSEMVSTLDAWFESKPSVAVAHDYESALR